MTIERIKEIVRSSIYAKVLLVALLIVCLLGYFKIYLTKGVYYDDTFLKKKASASEIRYTGRSSEGEINITVKGDRNRDESARATYRLPNNISRQYLADFRDASNWNLGVRSIRDENGNILFEGEYIKGSSILVDKNGKPLFEDSYRIIVNGEINYDESYKIPLLSIAEFACSAGGTVRGEFQPLFMAIVLLVITAIDMKFPMFFFLMRHSWDVKDPEPSEYYVSMQQAMHQILPLIGLGLMIIAIL